MRFPISPLIVYLILSVACADDAATEAETPDAPTPEALRQQALDALSSVNYEKALNIYSTLIELEPESPYNYFQRAFVRFTQKRFAKALPDLEAAIRIDDKHVQSKLYLAKCYHRMGNYEKAIANYKEVLELSPSETEAKSALETLENVQYAEEKLESLLKDGNCGTHVQQLLSTVLSEAQYNTKLLFARAKCSFERGQYHDALLDTGSILKSNRNHLDTYLLRGRSYYQLDDLDTALTHYKEGLRLDPEHKPLKTAYKELKALNKAINKAQESVKKGKLHEGLRFYEDALKKETKHKKIRSRLLLNKCQILVKLKKGIEAVRACSDALHLDPELTDAYGERGDAYILNEMYEEAVRDWKKAVEQSPKDGRLQNGLRNAEKQLKMSKRKDYYKILGVSKNAGEREIKRAYKKAALQWHPDKWKTDEEKEIAEKKFYDINEANEVLKDPDLRRRYDAGEDVMDPGAKQQQGGFHGGFPNGFPFRFGGGGPRGGGGGGGGGGFSFRFG